MIAYIHACVLNLAILSTDVTNNLEQYFQYSLDNGLDDSFG